MLKMPKALEPVVHEMCRRSPAFRRQLLRLADAPGLVVTLAIAHFRTSDHVRAKTRCTREQGLLRRADVEISSTEVRSLVELIGHELEHVIEQLDDVNLTHLAQGPGIAVREHRPRRFETARARQIGLSVAAEFDDGSVIASNPVVPR
jgi:hypothetical protein